MNLDLGKFCPRKDAKRQRGGDDARPLRAFASLREPFLVIAASLLVAAPAAARQASAPQVFAKGMVSAADPRAAEAGAEMLRRGGSATDAAIATMLALTVVEPQSSGIGGGGFLVSSDPAGRVTTIDGRETAPAAAHPKWFYANGKPLEQSQIVPGGTSDGVPGNVALAALAHARSGRLPWARLFDPAIRLAAQGFVVTPRLRNALVQSRRSAAFTAGARLFYDAAGEPLAVGTLVRNPALARTLQRIARRGPQAFYRGANARTIAATVNASPHLPAPMTTADIAAYRAKPREAVCATYRAYRICGIGPPSSGATTVIATLKQLERFDLTALGRDSPVAWHLIAESMRLAYADRARWLGDADFVSVPVAGLIDPTYLAGRSALIDPRGTMAAALPGIPPGAPKPVPATAGPVPENGTSHFVVIDRNGAAASYTSTIESAFGSGLVVNGYYLNNELTDFAKEPEQGGRPVANRVEAGKRPLSSMSPTLVFGPDGKLRLAVGAAGGTTIPAQVAKAIIGVIDWKLSAQEAIALPVLFVAGDTLIVEPGSRLEAMAPALQALGHTQVRARAMPLKANAVEVVGHALRGAADPRSEGKAVAE
jgi:gamma-glutamyltranspeptidase/glutathione hydrolase